MIPLRESDGAVYLDHRYERGIFGDLASLDRYASSLDKALFAKQPGYGELVVMMYGPDAIPGASAG